MQRGQSGSSKAMKKMVEIVTATELAVATIIKSSSSSSSSSSIIIVIRILTSAEMKEVIYKAK
jgi:hypothetical protein